MSLELSEQQIEAKKHLENWRVGALFMQAGTGKTRVACEIVNSARDLDFVLYVAPLGIIKKRAGIVDKVLVEYTCGGKVVRRSVPRYTLVSSHTGRRTFATTAYLAGIPIVRIMLLTGHKTEEAFFRYIRISKKENATTLSEHPFFIN